MEKTDLKKMNKIAFSGKKNPQIIEIPPMKYITFTGMGNPNTSKEYENAMGVLFGLAYTLKFKQKESDRDFVVAPLEGQWWADDIKDFEESNYDKWLWKMMIALPDYVREEDFISAVEALKLKKSQVGYFTLVGGILGFFTGVGLSIYTAVQWNFIIWGKPVVAWFPFIIVGFEFTILFSVLGNILGLITQTRLPEFQSLKQYDPRCSGDQFGIAVSCNEEEEEQVKTFLKAKGGEVRVFD